MPRQRDLPKCLRSPITATVSSNAIRLISPKTFAGILRFFQEINNIDVAKFLAIWSSVLFTIPLLVIVATLVGGGRGLLDESYLKRVGAAALFSPLTAGALVETWPTALQMASRAQFLTSQRKEFDADVIDALADGVNTGRLRRRARYDLYLPESRYTRSPSRRGSGGCGGKDDNSNNVMQKGLILIPGLLIDQTSYAQVASQLSDMGIVVVVMSMEPLRIATPDKADVRRVLHSASSELRNQFGGIEWSLGGHSLGGYAALSLASRLLPNEGNSHNNKIVVWGAGNLHQLVPDISSLHDCHVLSIQGSADAYCSFSLKDMKVYSSKLPPKSIHKLIRGGNHNGFASYPCTPMIDGVREIPLKKQHRYLCSATAKFLKQNRE